MFKSINTTFYGDTTRWFIGTVVETVGDPLPIPTGRVRVKILGIHDNVDISNLPWASVMLPTTEGGISSGFPPGLQEGAQVFGIFLDGVQSQVPLVLGTIPHLLADPSIEEGDGRYSSQDLLFEDPGIQGSIEPIPAPSESAEQTYTFFRSIGYSDAAARGIIGNFIVESGNFAPDVLTFERRGDNGTAYGLAQWRLDRVTGPYGLLTFSETRGLNPKNLTTQLKFAQYELDTRYGHVKAGLFKCTTPGQAAVHFMRKYEIPAFQGGVSSYPEPPWDPTGPYPRKRFDEDKRIAYAEGANFSGSYFKNSAVGPQ